MNVSIKKLKIIYALKLLEIGKIQDRRGIKSFYNVPFRKCEQNIFPDRIQEN